MKKISDRVSTGPSSDYFMMKARYMKLKRCNLIIKNDLDSIIVEPYFPVYELMTNEVSNQKLKFREYDVRSYATLIAVFDSRIYFK